MKWAAVEAAGSSPCRSGRAPSGSACSSASAEPARAARRAPRRRGSRAGAPPRPGWGTAQGGTLSVLRHLARELEQPSEPERARVQQRRQLPRRGARREERAQLGVHAREERGEQRQVRRRRAGRAGLPRPGGGGGGGGGGRAQPRVQLDGRDGAALRVEANGELEVLAWLGVESGSGIGSGIGSVVRVREGSVVSGQCQGQWSVGRVRGRGRGRARSARRRPARASSSRGRSAASRWPPAAPRVGRHPAAGE